MDSFDYTAVPDSIFESTALQGPVLSVYEDLEVKEGLRGDTTGAADTGEIGVTQSARDSVGGNYSDREVAKIYLEQLDEKLRNGIPRYSTAPEGVQEALLDTAYNAGPQMLQWEGMKDSMTTEDWDGALLNILDTANVDGMTMKGIAKRRAQAYNKGAKVPVDTIEQLDDGTLKYLDSNGSIIFSYKKDRHPKSAAGTIKL